MAPRRKRTAGGYSELRLPTPMLDYLFTLPGDYVKIALRLLQRARWVPGMTEDGLELDAGEVLISSRSSWLWSAVGRGELSEEGLRSLVRRVLQRLTRDGYISLRPARHRGPGSDPPRGPGGSTHPPTIVRFLRFRANLWPANKDPAHPPDREGGQDPAQARGPLLAVVDPPDPSGPAGKTPSPSPSAPDRGARRKGGNGGTDPRHRPLQQLLEAAYVEIRGTAYGFQGGRDANAITQLLQLSAGDVAEVDRRWRRALELGEKWPGCATIALLPGRWNELVPSRRNGAPASASSAGTSGAPLPAAPASSFTDGTSGFAERPASAGVRLRSDGTSTFVSPFASPRR